MPIPDLGPSPLGGGAAPLSLSDEGTPRGAGLPLFCAALLCRYAPERAQLSIDASSDSAQVSVEFLVVYEVQHADTAEDENGSLAAWFQQVLSQRP